MAQESPAVILYNEDGIQVTVKDGHIIVPADDSGIIVFGNNSGTARPISLNSSGNQIITGAGTAGSPDTGVVTVQGISGGTSLPFSSTQLPSSLSGGKLDTNIGSWLGSTVPTVGQKASANSIPVVLPSDQIIEVKNKNYASFTILSTAIQPALNKSMISIVNASGSSVIAKIQEIYLVNVQVIAAAGVDITFHIKRIENHTAGTNITAIETLDTLDSLSSSITAKTNSTVSGESSNILWKNSWNSDESSAAFDQAAFDHGIQTMFPIFSRKNADSKPIVLRANEGISIKCITSTTVGSFDLMTVLTQE